MNERGQLPANAETMNALVDAFGALSLVLLAHLPSDARTHAANQFAKFAKSAEARGELTLETFLMDLHRAARSAST